MKVIKEEKVTVTLELSEEEARILRLVMDRTPPAGSGMFEAAIKAFVVDIAGQLQERGIKPYGENIR